MTYRHGKTNDPKKNPQRTLTPEQRRMIEEMLLKAMYAVRHNEFGEAQQLITGILAEDPDHAHARRLKARIDLELERRAIRRPQPATKPEAPAPNVAESAGAAPGGQPSQPEHPAQSPAQPPEQPPRQLPDQETADPANPPQATQPAPQEQEAAALEAEAAESLRQKRLEEEQKAAALVTAMLDQAGALAAEGSFERAMELIDTVLREHPAHPAALERRETTARERERRMQEEAEQDRLRRQREAAAAKEQEEHARELRESAERTRKLIASLESQAAAAIDQARFAEAVSFADLILAQDPSSESARTLRTRAESERRRVQREEDERKKREHEDKLNQERERARAASQKAEKLVAAMLEHARALLNEGLFDQSETLADTVLSEHPDHKQAAGLKREIAVAREESGRKKAAADAESAGTPEPVAVPAQAAAPPPPATAEDEEITWKPRPLMREMPAPELPTESRPESRPADSGPLSKPQNEPNRKRSHLPVLLGVLVLAGAALVAIRLYTHRMENSAVRGASVGSVSPEGAKEYLEESAAAESRRQYDSAIACARKAAEADPEHPDGMRKLGSLLLRTGKIPEAIEQLNGAAAVTSNDSASNVLAAIALSLEGKPAVGFAALERVLPGLQDSSALLASLGAEIAASDPVLAAKYEQRIGAAIRGRLAARPGDYRLAYRLLLIMTAAGSPGAKSLEVEQMQSLMNAMGRSPNDPLMPAYLALTMTHHGYYDEAVQTLSSLDAADRNRPEVMYVIARVYALQAALLPNRPKSDAMKKNAFKALEKAVRIGYSELELASASFSRLRGQREFIEAITASLAETATAASAPRKHR